MFEKALVMYIYAETSLHPGSGMTISGAVDLPIQRERHTEFPMIQGSSLKGVLRNAPKGAKKDSKIALSNECENCPKKKGDEIKEACSLCGQIFGTQEGVGGISITDARILAFPVRTLKGVFGWITCPLVLGRYKRDLTLANISPSWNIPQLKEEAIIHSSSDLKVELNGKKYVFIEDLQLEVREKNDELLNDVTKEIARALPDDNTYKEIKEKLKKDLVIVSDDVFRDLIFLTTEVVTRIRIDPVTGTVDKKTGGLWSEEYLPTDTIMYSLILIPSRYFDIKVEELKEELKIQVSGARNTPEKIVKILESYDGQILQIGGDETIGKGFARVKLVKGGAESVKKP